MDACDTFLRAWRRTYRCSSRSVTAGSLRTTARMTVDAAGVRLRGRPWMVRPRSYVDTTSPVRR